MTTSQDFDLHAYEAMLAELKQQGYRAREYSDVDADARDLILRHDLDMSIQAALEVAKVEASLGFHATYFVLLRTEMYNLFSHRGMADLNAICQLGHGVGLHLDASLYPDEAALEAGAAKECAVLESLLGRTVEVISFHRPAPRFLGRVEPIAGRRHSYEPKFFNEIGYCSDSRGGWHHGHPLDHAAVQEGKALQLLTHPIWWTSTTDKCVQDKLDDFLLGRARFLSQEVETNCEAYNAGNSPFV